MYYKSENINVLQMYLMYYKSENIKLLIKCENFSELLLFLHLWVEAVIFKESFEDDSVVRSKGGKFKIERQVLCKYNCFIHKAPPFC